MVHPSGHAVIERPKEEISDDLSGVGESEAVKTVEVDFYIALIGGPHGQPIDYKKIRVFIDWLRRIGFKIIEANADQYMSFDHLQRLRDANFKSKVISTDKTSKPYRVLRQTANEVRIKLPYPTGIVERARLELMVDSPLPDIAGLSSESLALRRVILYNELTGLEHDVKRDKIDHRSQNPDGSKGSKDVADGVAGAVFRCLTDDDVSPNSARAYSANPGQTLSSRYNRYLQQVNF